MISDHGNPLQSRHRDIGIRTDPKNDPRPVFILSPNLSSSAPDKVESWDKTELGVMAEYVSGIRKLYIFVEVWYDDVFDQSHWMTVCEKHEVGTGLDKFAPCEHGAGTDGAKVSGEMY
jgi:hypothetical protein